MRRYADTWGWWTVQYDTYGRPGTWSDWRRNGGTGEASVVGRRVEHASVACTAVSTSAQHSHVISVAFTDSVQSTSSRSYRPSSSSSLSHLSGTSTLSTLLGSFVHNAVTRNLFQGEGLFSQIPHVPLFSFLIPSFPRRDVAPQIQLRNLENTVSPPSRGERHFVATRHAPWALNTCALHKLAPRKSFDILALYKSDYYYYYYYTKMRLRSRVRVWCCRYRSVPVKRNLTIKAKRGCFWMYCMSPCIYNNRLLNYTWLHVSYTLFSGGGGVLTPKLPPLVTALFVQLHPCSVHRQS